MSLKSYAEMTDVSERVSRANRQRMRAGVMSPEEAIKAVDREQHRQALREGRPQAIATAMVEAGLVAVPFVNDAYAISGKRVDVLKPINRWYAVQTAPQMEIKARDELGRINHYCYVPMRSYWRQLRSKDKAGKPLRKRVEAPLCPGYVFFGSTASNPDWRTIRGLDGVTDIVGHAGRPQPICDTIMLYALMSAEKEGAFDLAKEVPEWEATPGSFACVTSGPFKGLIATIRQAKGDVVRIIIDALFGGSVIKVKKSDLEPVPGT